MSIRSLNGEMGWIRSLNGKNPLINLLKEKLKEGEAIDITHDTTSGENTFNVAFKSNTDLITTLNDTDLVLISDAGTPEALKYITIANFKMAGTLWHLDGVSLYPDSTSYNLLVGTATGTGHKFLCSGTAKITGSLVVDSTLNVSDITTLTTLICNNTATFNRLATFEYPIVANSTLNVGDTTTLTTLICNNTATFNKQATFEFPVVMNSTLNVSDTTTLTTLLINAPTGLNTNVATSFNALTTRYDYAGGAGTGNFLYGTGTNFDVVSFETKTREECATAMNFGTSAGGHSTFGNVNYNTYFFGKVLTFDAGSLAGTEVYQQSLASQGSGDITEAYSLRGSRGYTTSLGVNTPNYVNVLNVYNRNDVANYPLFKITDKNGSAGTNGYVLCSDGNYVYWDNGTTTPIDHTFAGIDITSTNGVNATGVVSLILGGASGSLVTLGNTSLQTKTFIYSGFESPITDREQGLLSIQSCPYSDFSQCIIELYNSGSTSCNADNSVGNVWQLRSNQYSGRSEMSFGKVMNTTNRETDAMSAFYIIMSDHSDLNSNGCVVMNKAMIFNNEMSGGIQLYQKADGYAEKDWFHIGRDNQGNSIVLNDIAGAKWRIATGSYNLSFYKHDSVDGWVEPDIYFGNPVNGAGADSNGVWLNNTTATLNGVFGMNTSSYSSGKVMFGIYNTGTYSGDYYLSGQGRYGGSGTEMIDYTVYGGTKSGFFFTYAGTILMTIRGSWGDSAAAAGYTGIRNDNPAYPLDITGVCRATSFTPFTGSHCGTMDVDIQTLPIEYLEPFDIPEKLLEPVVVDEKDPYKNHPTLNPHTIRKKMLSELPKYQIKKGLLLSVVRGVNTNINQNDFYLKICDKKQSKSIAGIMSLYQPQFKQEKNDIMFNAVGEGGILVVNEGGDIEIGDYIQSSTCNGYGMKQTGTILHNYTCAKSFEDVEWNTITDTLIYKDISYKYKMIACSYTSA